MTISQAINEIAVAQGGTASTSGTIAGAIDALNDALAGSDQKAAQTIEDAVRLLGQNIGGGGSSDFTTAKIKLGSNATSSFTLPISFINHGALFSPMYSRDMDGEHEYDVALYGGHAVTGVDENITIQNYTGGIEVQGHTLIISGDGTITFTDGEN